MRCENLRRMPLCAAALAAAALLAGCDDDLQANAKPDFVGTVTSAEYDGNSDDLLTVGLGKPGLAGTGAPGYAVLASPAAAELRRNAMYTNYRALLDMTAANVPAIAAAPAAANRIDYAAGVLTIPD